MGLFHHIAAGQHSPKEIIDLGGEGPFHILIGGVIRQGAGVGSHLYPAKHTFPDVYKRQIFYLNKYHKEM